MPTRNRSPDRSMKTKNFGEFHVRKWYLQIEDTLANESVLADGEPVRQIVIGAAIHNAFSGRFVEDLNGAVRASGALGQEFGNRLKEAIGNARVASYGKACVVGVAGEYEHGNALLTTVFADPVRDAIGAPRPGFPPPASAARQAPPSTFRSPTRTSSTCARTTTR